MDSSGCLRFFGLGLLGMALVAVGLAAVLL